MSKNNKKRGIRSYKYGPLTGEADIPGDKSISHRSLILGALCVGKTRIHGLLEGEDVLCTAEAMKNFGSTVIRHSCGDWTVDGVGVGGFSEPNKVVDCGNSGTAARLILGAMSTSPITATFSGDESLIKRPMERVISPLRLFGTQFFGKSGSRFPMTAVGTKEPVSVEYTMPVPSAQVKSAILLAGLNAPGKTTIFESELT